MNVALGLFQFDIHPILGEPGASHRYCSQVVLPFVELLAAQQDFRVSIEMSGMGLEFLALHYPRVLDEIRRLVERKQVELISSVYAPTAWVAFPRRDLERSIEINREVLQRLSLVASRVFAAPEGFCGAGLEAVHRWFDVVLCKDSNLQPFQKESDAAPIYRFGDIKLVVGANHLLHEMAATVIRFSEKDPEYRVNSFIEGHLQEAVQTLTHSPSGYVDGSIQGLKWHWYHFGLAHHFTTSAKPRSWELFFWDAEWMSLTSRILRQQLEAGYSLTFVSEFVHAYGNIEIKRAPLMIESYSGTVGDTSVSRWMGRHEHRWDAGASLLTLVWRARTALRQIESELLLTDDDELRRKLQWRVDEIWKQLILAECGGPFSAGALPPEVDHGRVQGDLVLELCTKLSSELNTCDRLLRETIACSSEPRARGNVCEPIVDCELLGAEGSLIWWKVSETEYRCESRFRVEERVSGVRFRCKPSEIAYCPTCMETQAVGLPQESLEDETIVLPLANGYIGLDASVHLIRDNCMVAVAARVSRADSWVSFLMEGVTEGKIFEWRFTILLSSQAEAVGYANRLNVF